VNGVSSLTYGPINLGGGANYVTGTLPAGNQAPQSMGGDVTGTTAASTVVQLTGAANVVSTPNVSGWKLTSSLASVGDVITTSTNILTFGNTTTVTNVYLNSGGNAAIQSNGSGGYVNLVAVGGGTIYSDANKHRFRDSAGNEYFQLDFTSPSFKIDSASGTFPSSGFIRTKAYGSTTDLWEGRNSGGDAVIISQNASALTIGDANATSGWNANLNGVNVNIQSRGASYYYVGAGVGTLRITDFSSAVDNLLFDISNGGNTKIRFNSTQTPFIIHDNLTTASGTGATFTIQAQNETGTTSIGGNLVLTSGTGTSTHGSLLAQVGGTTKLNLAPTTSTLTATNSIALQASGGIKLTLDGVSGTSSLFSNTNIGFASTTGASTDALNLVLNDTGATQIKFSVGVTPTIFQSTRTTDAATNVMTIQSQNAFASATGTNRNGANLLIMSGAKAAGGTDGYIGFYAGGYEFARIARDTESYLSLDSSTGTFPSTGLIRFKNYTGATTAIAWQNVAGSSPILQLNGTTQRITFGDTDATVGTDLVIQASFGLTIQTRGSAMNFYAAGGGYIFNQYSTGNKNLTIPVAIGGAAANMTFGENVIPTFGQDQATTNNNGQTLTIKAQAAKSGSGGTGGNLELQTGQFDGGGAAGSFVLKSGTGTTRVSVNDSGTWTLAPTTVFTSSSGSVSYGATSQAYLRGSSTRYISVDNVGGGCQVQAPSGEFFSIGSTIQDLLRFKWTDSGAGSIEVDTGKTSFTIKQNDLTTASGTGATLTIQAQNETGTTSTGGSLALKSGTGTTVAGNIGLFIGANETIRVAPGGGTAIATTGIMRVAKDFGIQARNAADTANIPLLLLDGSNNIQIGDLTSTASVQIDAVNTVYLLATAGSGVVAIEAATDVFLDGSTITIRDASHATAITVTPLSTGATTIRAATGVTSFTINQADRTSASATGATTTIQAQNATGTTSTGGNLVLTSGTGTSTNGTVNVQSGGTTMVAAAPTGVTLATTTTGTTHVGKNTFTTRTVTGTLTIDTTTTDMILLVDTSGGAFTITLPAPANGRTIILKDIKGTFGTSNLTLARNGSEKIEGVAASYVFSSNWGHAVVISNGTDWFLLL
jgi:hypothetical protein